MTRHELLTSVGKTVHGLISQITPDPEVSCMKAFEKLGAMVRTSKAVTALEEPAYFTAGIQEIIGILDAHRTGFARTAEQENGAVKKSAKDLTLTAFAAHASQVVTKALADVEAGRIGSALESLHTLYRDIVKAESFEDTNTATIAITNDPMRVIETEAAGSMTADLPGGASNYVLNPGDVKGAPPSTEANPSTGSVTALPVAAAGTPAFVDTAKAADAEIAKSLEGMVGAVEKSGTTHRVIETGWAADLNSSAFRGGASGKVDFEAGLPKRG
jgi:hypothetical protein